LAVVTLSWRWVDLEDVPRRVEPGTTIALRGELRGGYRDPVIAVSPPNGSVERIPGGGGPQFEVAVPTDQSGVYRLEVLAQGPRGSTVIANFPLYVGTEVPSSVNLRRDEELETDDPAEVVAMLTRLVNRSRQEAGLPPVQVEPTLAAVAEAHSTDMVENDFVGHTSPSSGSARDRVTQAGIQTGLVLENIGRGYGPVEIHRGLLESPGHRANIMNPDVTHVGVGVVAEEEGDRTAFMATELFILMTREIDTEAAPEVILDAINRVRRARSAVPLDSEENLARAAQEAAERFVRDPSLTQQEVVDDASGSLRRFGIAWSRVGGLLAVVTRLDEAADFEPSFDPDIRYAGIGVAQGTRPDTPANAITVVILLAWPR
ncbi:MAG: CAP domain-containing protein, partial [Myxococcota bacterium]